MRDSDTAILLRRSDRNLPLRLWLTLLLSLFCALPAFALEASVDRAVVAEGDSLTLTIRRSDDGDGEPDYSPLAADFHLFGRSQSNRSVISNGRAESWTEWQVTLIPKRTGQMTIPSIAVGGDRTEPIRIEVRSPQQSASGNSSRDPVFIETSVDNRQLYVEQQLLLTVRVYLALTLEDMQLSDPDIDNAQVEKVAQSNFRRDIDGITYQVHELVYAIFPQQPGQLLIPELLFSGRQPLRPRSFFDFPGQGRALRRMSQAIRVEVKPIPPQFSGAVWLPARNLTLVESWNGNPDRLAVGESMTRSLTLQADGILAAQLPELEQPAVEGGRLYADQPQLENNTDAQGVRGKRVQSAALIPTRAGPLQLPGARIVWWDVDSDSEKVAEIAPRQLRISPASQAASTTASSPTEVSLPGGAGNTGGSTGRETLIGWQIATALLACGWAVTLLWMWRRAPAERTTPEQTVGHSPQVESEPAAFKQLQSACRDRQPAAARNALLTWAEAWLQREQVTMEQLQQIADDRDFDRAVETLERKLYANHDAGSWDSGPLLATVERIRKKAGKKRSGPSAGSALPPLYPGR